MTLGESPLIAEENIHCDVRQRGLDIATVEDLGLAGSPDTVVLQVALDANRIALTHDADFGSLAVAARQPMLGVVYLRPGHIEARFTIETLIAVLGFGAELAPPFLMVAVRSRDKVRIRVRAL